MDRQEGLGDDVQAGGGQQRVDVGDAPGDRILDRDHAEVGRFVLQRSEGVLEGGAGQRRAAGIIVEAGDVRIGARLALVGDGLGFGHGLFPRRQHLAGATQVFGRVDAERRDVDERDVDAHARLQRAQLFEPLAPLQRRGRQRDEARQRLAAIGVEADVMQERPLAPGRSGPGEIERAQAARADLGPHRLDDVGIVALLGARDLGRQRRDVHLPDRSAGRPRRAPRSSRWSADRPAR